MILDDQLCCLNIFFINGNRIKFGQPSWPAFLLVKMIDKNMLNKFTIIRKKGYIKFDGGLQSWFGTR